VVPIIHQKRGGEEDLEESVTGVGEIHKNWGRDKSEAFLLNKRREKGRGQLQRAG